MVFRPYLGYFCVFHSMPGNFCFSEITWLFLGVSEYAGVISVVFKVFCGYFWWGFRVCLVISGVFRVHRGYFGGCQSMPGYFWGFQSMPGYFCIFQSMLWLFLGVSESSWLFLFFLQNTMGCFWVMGLETPWCAKPPSAQCNSCWVARTTNRCLEFVWVTSSCHWLWGLPPSKWSELYILTVL